MKTEEEKISGILQTAAPYMTLGLQIAAAVVLFLFIGKFADEQFGTKPWLMVAGIVIGFTGGMIHFFREVIALSNKEEHERRNKV
ncbi:MAG: AtpZ/AtpI family protein [Bacteroidota bacterium]